MENVRTERKISSRKIGEETACDGDAKQTTEKNIYKSTVKNLPTSLEYIIITPKKTKKTKMG